MNKPIEETELEGNEELETEELEGLEEELDGEDGDQGEDEQEFEITLDGEDGSQPAQSNNGIRKRINKLNAKVSEAQDGTAQANSELENERQKNKLLELALQQKKEAATPSGPPDPLDYDNGARDAKYVQALSDYTGGLVRAELAKQPVAPEPEINQDRMAAQTRHYEAAEKLGAGDYEEVEDHAIDILGRDTVNQLIEASESSPQILYYLGKNPGKAESLAELVKSNPVKAVMEIGALGARLKVTSKAKRKQAPNPDGELEGSTSPRSSDRGLQGATFE